MLVLARVRVRVRGVCHLVLHARVVAVSGLALVLGSGLGSGVQEHDARRRLQRTEGEKTRTRPLTLALTRALTLTPSLILTLTLALTPTLTLAPLACTAANALVVVTLQLEYKSR